MTDHANVRLVRRIYEAFNRGDAAALAALAHAPSTAVADRIDALQSFLRAWRDAVPDLRLELDEVVSADDARVTVRATLRGTQQGPFLGIEADGAPFAVTTTDTFEFVAGKWAA